MLLYGSEFLRVEGRTPIGEMSQQSKARKNVVTETIVVLSASTEEHGTPCSKPTYEVVPIPLDPRCPEQTIQIGKDLGP